MDCNTLYISSLNSGSNGNCYYVGNADEAVLIDAGISCKEIEKRMLRLNLPMSRVRALFISHEHSDHIKGVCVLARKYNLPVYLSPGTHAGCGFDLQQELIFNWDGDSAVQIGALTVTAFRKIHDARDPHSFMVTCGDTHVGIFTDLGAVCEPLRHHFKQCHGAFLEANYDTDMLNNGKYPYFLKKRISGGSGHLSNAQALELFLQHKNEKLSHLLLSHLSKDNNKPELVEDLFKANAGSTEIVVASRYQESEVYVISSDPDASVGISPRSHSNLQLQLVLGV
ncbi:MAG: MBL fold metallo-hydrolase [Pedobacter sp.]|nr:MAG: MBL fold metallo-hydrolase [Pedobacter sp.]